MWRASASILALLAASTACGTSGPISPTGVSTSATTIPSSPAPQPTFAPPSGPARVFTFDHELSYSVRDYTKNSRFVLYDSGAFDLDYPGGGYGGSWTDANGVITFEWKGWSAAGPWGATATLQGDTLTVRYNIVMQLTDFEDAAYRRTQ